MSDQDGAGGEYVDFTYYQVRPAYYCFLITDGDSGLVPWLPRGWCLLRCPVAYPFHWPSSQFPRVLVGPSFRRKDHCTLRMRSQFNDIDPTDECRGHSLPTGHFKLYVPHDTSSTRTILESRQVMKGSAISAHLHIVILMLEVRGRKRRNARGLVLQCTLRVICKPTD